MSVIRTENLTYTYSQGTPFEKTAVKDVNIEIEEGELVGIIGHTGSGKSTLIQHLNGLIKPTSGKIFIDGADIHDKDIKLRDVRFKVGLVFQYPEYQIFEETVYDSLLNKSPFELSGGQKRRVAIAGVMAMRPKVLILDEPTAGLDPRGREMILGQIKHYHEETGSTVLLVSHSMEDVARFAQKILVMNKGEVFCYDTPPAVFARADEIAAIGLSVPQITKVFSMLRSRGIDIRGDVYTIEFAMKTINEYLAAKGKAGEGNA